MITLKLKSYNRLELEALCSMLRTFCDTTRNCNRGKMCKICEYSHICLDCYCALDYAEAKLDEATGTNLPY